MDFVTPQEKTAQNNISFQNFSVENNYLKQILRFCGDSISLILLVYFICLPESP